MYKPLPESVTIKPSGINGLGLFANQDINKGTNMGLRILRLMTRLSAPHSEDLLIIQTPQTV